MKSNSYVLKLNVLKILFLLYYGYIYHNLLKNIDLGINFIHLDYNCKNNLQRNMYTGSKNILMWSGSPGRNVDIQIIPNLKVNLFRFRPSPSFILPYFSKLITSIQSKNGILYTFYIWQNTLISTLYISVKDKDVLSSSHKSKFLHKWQVLFFVTKYLHSKAKLNLLCKGAWRNWLTRSQLQNNPGDCTKSWRFIFFATIWWSFIFFQSRSDCSKFDQHPWYLSD